MENLKNAFENLEATSIAFYLGIPAAAGAAIGPLVGVIFFSAPVLGGVVGAGIGAAVGVCVLALIPGPQ